MNVNRKLLAALRNLLAVAEIHPDITTWCDGNIIEAREAIAAAEKEEAAEAARRKLPKDYLTEISGYVSGTYKKGSPADRNPFTGGSPEEPPEIEDLYVRLEVDGHEIEAGEDSLLRDIESAVLDSIEEERRNGPGE